MDIINSPLPHILLPILLFLSLYLPPFRARAPIFSIAIVATIAAGTLSDYPQDRMQRYALAGAWTFYFPVLQKLLLMHPSPEHHCWRLDRVPHEAEVAIRPFFWEKARWAAALLISPRGVGWSHGSKRLPVGPGAESRARFVARHLGLAILGNLAVEAATLGAEWWKMSRMWSLEDLPRILVAELLMGGTVWGAWMFQYSLAAALGVGLGLTEPKDWPPFFGSVRSASSIAGFWGTFWHGMLRQPALGFSHFFLSVLAVPKRTPLAHAIHLFTAFGFSTFFHIISLYTISHGYISLRQLCSDITLFFMGQAVAILLETWATSRYGESVRGSSSKPQVNDNSVRSAPTRFVDLFGYVWVLAWLGLSGWLFVRIYVALGTLEWKTPIRILEPLLGWIS